MFKRILVPVDGSETANFALQEALKFAREQGARVYLVHAYEQVLHTGMEGNIDLTEVIRTEGADLLAQAEAKARAAGVEVSTALIDAAARRIATAVAEEAARLPADLIMMGTHGRRGFEHLVLGSVAEGVVRRATLPVLLIPRKE